MRLYIHTPRAASVALRVFGILLLATLAGCGPTNTLVDESASVSGGSYWSRQINLPSSGPVKVDLSSSSMISCYLMNQAQFSTFQSSVSRGFGSFQYMADFSKENTSHFTEAARLPAGTWNFVVVTTRFGNGANFAGQALNTASFSIKINGDMSASAGGGYSPPPPAQQPPSQSPPQFSTPPMRNTPPQAYVPPPPPPLKLTFANFDEATEMLRRGQPPERQAALSYISEHGVSPITKKAVFEALTPLARDPNYQHQSLQILLKWAASDDIPTLRGILESMIGGDPAHLDPVAADDALALAKYLLAAQDTASITPAIRLLHAPSTHDGARQALADLGAPAEPAMIDALSHRPDAKTATDILGLLANSGSEKSIQPIQDLMAGKDDDLTQAAGHALTRLAARLNLTPDQYLFNLYSHYAIDAPVGFTPDSAMTAPNTKRWTRQAPGRAVKSTFTVQVTHVAPDFQLNAPPNGNTLQAGPLTFHGMDAPASPQFTHAVRMTAQDREYLIDITAVVDTADTTGQNNITTAVKKIHAK